MGPPKKLQSGIIRILRGILANHEKQVLQNMSDKRESFVKTQENNYFLKRALLPAFWHIYACVLDGFLLQNGGPLGTSFLYFRVFFGVFFSILFRSSFSGGPEAKK